MKKRESFIKAGALYTVGNVFIRGINFFTIPIFTRLMLPEDYGIYSVFMSYAAIFTIIINLAYHTNLKNAKYDFLEEFENYSATCFHLIYFGFVALLFFGWCAKLIGIINVSYFLLFFILMESFSQASVSYYVTYLSIKVQTASYLFISFLYSILSLLLSICFIKISLLGSAAENRILGVVLPNVLVALYITWFYRKNKNFRKLKQFFKYGCKISIPLLPHAFAQIILSQFDRLMISKMVSFSSAGIYAFAANISSILMILALSFDIAWEPWFFNKMDSIEYNLIRKKSTIYLLFFLMLAIGLVLISPEIVFFLAPKEYKESIYLAIPLIGAVFFIFMYYLPSGIEYFYKKTFYISIGTVSAALLNVVLNYFMIKKIGYMAASYTTEFCYIAYFIFHILIAIKIIGKEKFCKIFNIIFFIVVIFVFLIVSIIAILFAQNVIIRWSIMIVLCLPLFIYCIKQIYKSK